MRILLSENEYQTSIYLTTLFTLSFFSYFFIERRIRKTKKFFWLFTITALIGITIITIGIQGHLNGGFPKRNKTFESLRNNNGWGLICNGNTSISSECSNNSNPDIAIFGNSYAMTYVLGIAEKNNAVQLTQDSCAISYIHDYHDMSSKPCQLFIKEAIATMANSKDIKTVVISSPFNHELSSEESKASLKDVINALGEKNIFIFGPTPVSPFNVGECFVKYKLTGKYNCDFNFTKEQQEKIISLREIISDLYNVEFIDVSEYICHEENCIMRTGDESPIYYDKFHLTHEGAKLILDKSGLFK